jgi:hypothetical protein
MTMSSLTERERNGQVLVQVAMLMVVFLLFLAIAIDVGNILTERRRMQNAADAGALAGAWEICFGDPARAETTAQEYAVDRNGAQMADVSIAGGEVTVYAREATPTYLMRIFGVATADVNGMAVAACGGDTGPCKFWPITFHETRWDQIECGETFYVWNDKSLETECYTLDIYGECVSMYDACVFELETQAPPPDDKIRIVGPGDRGWVNLPRPERPSPSPHCADNCGSHQVWCWINEENGYTGNLDLTGGGYCLPGEAGVSNNVRHEIYTHPGEEVNILIWNHDPPYGPCSQDEIEGTCAGTPYRIVETGCIVLDPSDPTPEIDLPANPEYFEKPFCEQNVKVVKVTRGCECEDECGKTDGELPDTGEVRSVSLIK